MGLAALRAHLLQALHPLVAAGMNDHSRNGYDVGCDIWDRTRKTLGYITVVTFGSCPQVLATTSRLRAVHARVHGLTEDGLPYRADDPQLLVWSHNCLVASFLEITTRGGLKLSGLEQDTYIAEQVRAATLLGLEPDLVARDRAGLLDYFRTRRPQLSCTPLARQAAQAVLAPPSTDASGRPLPDWSDRAALALAALPGWARRLYAPTLPTEHHHLLPQDDISTALRDLHDR